MKALNVVITVLTISLAGLVMTVNSEAAALAEDEGSVFTQYGDTNALFNKFERGLVFGLSSDVKGVVESSIFNAVNFKVAYPDFTSDKVEERLNKVALEAETHSVRYKAYLALAYYKNQSQFKSPEDLLALVDHKNQNDIFFYLQETVQSDQFTSNLN
jgi:hypothetical protein